MPNLFTVKGEQTKYMGSGSIAEGLPKALQSDASKLPSKSNSNVTRFTTDNYDNNKLLIQITGEHLQCGILMEIISILVACILIHWHLKLRKMVCGYQSQVQELVLHIAL